MSELRQTLFSPDEDWWANAHLDTLPSMKEVFYQEGYRRAADILSEYVCENGRSQDFLIFPIVFLYRHSIELRLKEIIRTGRTLMEEKGEHPYHHKINNLWTIVKDIAVKVWPDGDIDELQGLEVYIQVLDELDPHSFAFRYPVDKKGNKSLPELGVVGVGQFSKKMQEALNVLDGMAIALDEYLDIKNEMEWEYRQYYEG